MNYQTSLSDAEAIGFMKQDSSTQTSDSDLRQLKDVLTSFEQLRSFAEKLNADLPTVENVVTLSYERRMDEAVEGLFRKVSTRIAAVDAKTRDKMKYIEHAMQARLASRMAVQNAEHGQYFRSQLDELIQAHEKEVRELNTSVKQAKQQVLLTEESERVTKSLFDRAKTLLAKNNITADFIDVEVDKQEKTLDLKEYESEVQSLRKALADNKANMISLEKQLRSQKAARLENLRLFQQERVELNNDLAAKKKEISRQRELFESMASKNEVEIRKSLIEQQQVEMRAEILKQQKQWLDRERTNMADAEARFEAEKRNLIAQQDLEVMKIQKKHQAAVQKREAEHQQEIQRLKQMWEKKLFVTQKSLDSFSSTETIRAITDRQSKILQLASALYGGGSTTVNDRLPPIQVPGEPSLSPAASISRLPPLSSRTTPALSPAPARAAPPLADDTAT